MKIIDKAERKYGHLAIRNLMTYIVGLNAFVFILMNIDPRFINKIVLNWGMVKKGELWRLITYIFIPPESSPLFIIFVLYFYYMMASALEGEWGSFRFNIYYIVGMIATTISAIITNASASAVYLNLSLFLAFARLYPNYQILLFFILPIRVKYLSWVYLASIAYTVLTAPFSSKVIALVSLANYFLFFGREIFINTRERKRIYHNRKVYQKDLPSNITIHRCTICGITEKDDPKMMFRYCVECDGDYEYCMEHLNTHTHIKNNS